MPQLRRAAAAVLVVLCGVIAQAEDGSRSLDSAATGEARSLDSADKGESVDLDAANSGGSESLDAAGTDASAPAPLPEIDDATVHAQAQDARDAVVAAQQRSTQANAAYSKMRARDYPQGDARAAIVKERDAARQAYEQASARYQEILKQLQ